MSFCCKVAGNTFVYCTARLPSPPYHPAIESTSFGTEVGPHSTCNNRSSGVARNALSIKDIEASKCLLVSLPNLKMPGGVFKKRDPLAAATQLVHLPEVERLSASVIRILGGNPSKVCLPLPRYLMN
jgi:hypothetical protein